jgi:ubiquinone/menaquinone biosynthesis C-methylase UbiE
MDNIIDIYNEIADEFDVYRTKIWNCVLLFLNNLPPNSSVLDIGCGNGKNFMARKDLIMKGIDLCQKFVNICKNKELDVHLASMTKLPFEDNTFDAFITIASYHHLDNNLDREMAIKEMNRVLKPNGRGLIVVWAMEQGDKTKFNFTKSDELVEWKSPTGKIYNRYYHIYRKGELEKEINDFSPNFKILNVGLECGNWYVELTK